MKTIALIKRGRNINKLKIIIKLCITALLFGYILITNDIMLAFYFFSNISLAVWLFIALLFLLMLLLLTVRFAIFFPEQKNISLLYVRLISTAYGFILPGQVAVEGVRAYMLGKSYGDYGYAGAAITVDKILSVIALFIMGTVGIFLTGTLGFMLGFVFISICIILLLLLVSLCFTFFYENVVKLFTWFSKKTGKFGKVFVYIISLVGHWRTFAKNKSLIIKSFIFGLLFQLVCAAFGALLSYGVGATGIILEWLWILPMFSFALMLPITLGGIGVREGSLIGLLSILNINPEYALAIAFGFLGIAILQALMGIIMQFFLMAKREDVI